MSSLYHFGEFVLDPAKRTLTRADSPVSLTPKAFDVLLFLAQNPNRLVTKEELERCGSRCVGCHFGCRRLHVLAALSGRSTGRIEKGDARRIAISESHRRSQ